MNNIYNKYLSPEEKSRIKLLRLRISTAKSLDEVDLYKQEIALIMTNMIRRYSNDYNSRGKTKRKAKVTGKKVVVVEKKEVPV
jgi:hypothetical protein